MTPQLTVVVIGRNEGERLARCLASVYGALAGRRYELIYVDSASTDDSVAIARGAGAAVVALAPGGLSAARARNAGWLAARGRWVLFLDGDTELQPAFLDAAEPWLRDDGLGAIFGFRFEKHPERSAFQRLLDIEWLRFDGEAPYFGGDVLVRRQALVEAGGYDPTLRAGEEPELSQRIRAAGWQIRALDVPMTAHDLAMTRFGQYWQRARRTGQAYAEVSARFADAQDGLWRREARHNVRQVAIWTILLGLVLAGAVGGQALLAAAGLAGGVALCLRSAWRVRHRFAQRVWALRYGVHAQFQHLPIFVGQLQVWLRGQGSTVCYKELAR